MKIICWHESTYFIKFIIEKVEEKVGNKQDRKYILQKMTTFFIIIFLNYYSLLLNFSRIFPYFLVCMFSLISINIFIQAAIDSLMVGEFPFS